MINMLSSLKNKFLYFSLIFIISGVSFFVAYNWKNMGNFEKMGVPASLIILGTAGWFFFKKDIYKNLSLFFSSFMIGSLFAVFGQVYQTGADVYSLFLNWGIFIFLFALAGCFYPIWILNTAVLTTALILYLKLYLEISSVLFFGAVFLFAVLFIYIFTVKFLKIEINKTFFYLLAAAFIIFITVSAILEVWKTGYFFGVHNEKNQVPLYYAYYIRVFYFLMLGAFTYISEKKLKRSGVLPLTVVSVTLFLWAEISYLFSKIYDYALFIIIPYYFIVITLFCISIFILTKLSMQRPNEYFKKTVKIIAAVIKFLLLWILVMFVFSFLYVIGLKEHVLLAGAVSFFVLSYFIPKIVKFKTDKTEIITFISALVLLGSYLSIEDIAKPIYIVVILTIIFDLFFVFRYSRAFDYLFVFVHSGMLSAVLLEYTALSSDNIFFIIFIGTVVLLGTAIIFEKNKNINNEKSKRIIRGLEFLIFTEAVINMLDVWKVFSVPITCLVSAVSIILIFKNLKNSNILPVIIVSVGILGIGYFSAGFPNISIAVMLIVLYIHRKEKYYEIIACVFLALELSHYYYSTHNTLLEKSFSMLETGGVLLAAYLLLKFFCRKDIIEEGEYER